MRRWIEVLLVVVLVALAARFFCAEGGRIQSAVTDRSCKPRHREPGGLRHRGAYPEMYARAADGISGSIGPYGIHRWGKELSRNSKVILRAGDRRDKAMQERGKPVGFNSDNSKWSYWTRGLPNPKMGILISFNKQNEIEQIDLASDWSRLATQMAVDSIPKRR